jgi:hypothetical protein
LQTLPRTSRRSTTNTAHAILVGRTATEAKDCTMRRSVSFAALGLAGLALAHGGAHEQKPVVAEDANWMTKHMAGTCRTGLPT